MRRRRLIIFLISVVLFLLLLPFAFLTFEHVRGRIGLARYKRELTAKGVKLSPEDLKSPVPEGENGAPEIAAAAKLLDHDAFLQRVSPPAMVLLPSGRAVVGFQELEWFGDWQDKKVTNNWDHVAGELETNAAALKQIRAALEKPLLDNHADFSIAPRMPYPELGMARTAALWFRAASQLALGDGRQHDAADNLVSEIRLIGWFEKDGLAISELVRFAQAQIALTGTWEALQKDGWSDSDLVLVQKVWGRQLFADHMVQAFQGELVFGEVCAASFHKSNTATFDTIYAMDKYLRESEDADVPMWERLLTKLPHGDAIVEFCQRQLYCRIFRFAWLDQNEHRSLEGMHDLMEVARTAAATKSLKDVQPAMEEITSRSAEKNFYDALRFPLIEAPQTLTGVIKKGMRAETGRSLVLCAIAIKRYSLKYKKLPASLDAMVPEFLSAVPSDYMDGNPIRYHPKADGSFTLYSVGEDGKDDGGDGGLPAGKSKSRNPWDRKDFVWPAPATAAEVEAYRNGNLKN